MIEHTYCIRAFGASWWVYIKILADIEDYRKAEQKGCVSAGEGVWIKFSEQPLGERELFYEGDLPYLVNGLQMVQKEIVTCSMYQETLIVIKSLQYNPCDFQEEGLTAAVMEWAALAFGFSVPAIGVSFHREQNRYLFDFKREG